MVEVFAKVDWHPGTRPEKGTNSEGQKDGPQQRPADIFRYDGLMLGILSKTAPTFRDEKGEIRGSHSSESQSVTRELRGQTDGIANQRPGVVAV